MDDETYSTNKLAGLLGRDRRTVRKALDRILAAHEPYPAVVFDRAWNLVATKIPSIARESSRKPAGPLRRVPRSTPFQRLPRNSNARPSAAVPRSQAAEVCSWFSLRAVAMRVHASLPVAARI